MSTHADVERARQDGSADKFSDAAKAGADKITDKGLWTIPSGMEQSIRRIGEATERYGRTFGFSGKEGTQLATQSQQHMDAMKQCGTVLTKAFQDSSDTWMAMIQDQWKRNRDGMDKLMQAKTVHEFSVIQGELVRENLEQVLKDSRALAGRSMSAAVEAKQALVSLSTKATDDKA
ncbi:phasin family protein [Methylobacterium sp. WL9]|uniref:phasin family protein n=1 Tax=Methylobacterium sp. WL9 TaxID=2603898 RepID=UPI0011CBA275|nr:phasin family protein [Methylobacterium sp. WL9]TXN21824.1 phasin family protein [Methylobacterium sp. WL9]